MFLKLEELISSNVATALCASDILFRGGVVPSAAEYSPLSNPNRRARLNGLVTEAVVGATYGKGCPKSWSKK